MGSISGPATAGMNQMTSNWNTKPFAEKAFAVNALSTAARNIDLFANAKNDPMGAVVGAVNIVASFAAVIGPSGMILSVGFSFLSGLFSLFGKKAKKPKSVGQIVKETIDNALDDFYDQSLSDEARGTIEAMRHSKAFLDGVSSSGELISEGEAMALGTHVPVYRGLKFMGTLATVIGRLVGNNRPKDAKRCIKYIELYCTMATLKSMILQEFGALLPESHKNIRLGVFATHRSLLDDQMRLMGFLYSGDTANKIMPYYDPDSSPVTDAYLLKMLKVNDYDRSLTGTYCIKPAEGPYKNWNLAWSTSHERYSKDRPYATVVSGSGYCYWKIVPHGKNLYSIVNTRRCPNDQYCGALLSYDEQFFKQTNERTTKVTLDLEDPVLWKISGTNVKK